ncbi:ATP-binding cassette domain-containing protein [Thermoflavimicrobium daqui]|uniref:ABC transporter domain-containing protein n=1 Tax=Thermoflavimicrobium daqui TaxID=2137476 RepID=A0A364K560_9BACL|nr:ATP-binding cassette domain-containing protein [Thermoflavimicrobium daqui]RAL24505.1 hypothetical protein DL897_09345 [Thermoflavimicrobium daqui]
MKTSRARSYGYHLRTSKKYRHKYAVKDVSIHIKLGEIYGCLGKNGAGKTATMRMLLRINTTYLW